MDGLLYAKHSAGAYTGINSFTLHNNLEVGTVIIRISETRQLEHNKVTDLPKDIWEIRLRLDFNPWQ